MTRDLSWDEDAPPKFACHRCHGHGCDPFEETEPCLRCGATGIEPNPSPPSPGDNNE